SPRKNDLSLLSSASWEWVSRNIAYDTGSQNSTWLHIPVSPDYTFEYLMQNFVVNESAAERIFYPICGSYSSNYNFSYAPEGINLYVCGVQHTFDFPSDNMPHLFSAVVKPPYEVQLYCDGKLFETRATNIAVLEKLQVALGYSRGANAVTKDNMKFFACRIYDRALNDMEILQNYNMDKERYAL
ncbi:MAG: hypothetical protein IJO48_02665, partial [Clostridia bacterium]|nr:hypothetical protein [Clostridia bacterium]